MELNNLKKLLSLTAAMFMLNTNAIASEESGDRKIFQDVFTRWAHAFNEKDLATTEALFADDCVASNPGAPHKDHAAICALFKKLFAEQKKRFVYDFKIRDVYRTQDFATVRITWYLDIYENDKLIARSEEQGMDVFHRSKSGVWQIVNFIAYSEDLPLEIKPEQSTGRSSPQQ